MRTRILLLACLATIGAAAGASAQDETNLACLTVSGSTFASGPGARGGPWAFETVGSAHGGFRVTATGTYTFVFVARGSPGGGAWPRMEVFLDGRRVLRAVVGATNPATYAQACELASGEHDLEIAYFNDYYRPPEDRNLYLESVTLCSPPGAAAPVQLDAHGTAAVRTALRERWTADAEARIRQIRRGKLSVWVMDERDRPATNAAVSIRQTRHEFPFGTALCTEPFSAPLPSEETDRYLDAVRRYFNHAVTENAMKWPNLEPRQDKPDYSVLDRMVAWCETNRIALRGHCLFWGCEIPPWTADLAEQDLRAAVRRRATGVPSRYAGRIDEFDVVNEPLHCGRLEELLGESIAPMMFDWAREANLNAVLYVNEYNILSGAEVGAYGDYIRRLLDAGAEVGGIGIQAHYGAEVNPLLAQQALDDLARYGLPLKITEFDCYAEDEEVQARSLENLYRVAFAHPAVEGILMWGFWEKCHWRPAAALLRADFSRKPSAEAYERLLFSNWWTRLEARVDAVGRCETPAFFGDYEIEARLDDGRTTNATAHLARALGAMSVTLRMPPPEPEEKPEAVGDEATANDEDEDADEEDSDSALPANDLPGIGPDAF